MATARGYQPYCSVCQAIDAAREEPDFQAQVDVIFDKLDRISRIRAAYGRRRRR